MNSGLDEKEKASVDSKCQGLDVDTDWNWKQLFELRVCLSAVAKGGIIKACSWQNTPTK